MLNPNGQFDVVIVGAGVIGSAVAMALSERGVSSIVVLDFDLSGEFSSSELNAGGVRGTWSNETNLRISKQTIEFFEKHAELVGYRPCGYLWMHKKETIAAALELQKKQVSWGWEVDALDVSAIRAGWPFINKTEDLGGAIFGKKDGLVNPNRLKELYRERAVEKGVRFFDSVWVRNTEVKGSPSGGDSEVVVSGIRLSEAISSEQKRRVLENPASVSELASKPFSISAKRIVNAAGAWAPQLAKLLGYQCPSYPVRRQISLFHARDLDLTPYGMMIDPSGVYFHPESIYGLAGYAIPTEPQGYHFNYEGDSFFEEYIWAQLHERSTYFESLKHVSGWSGLYETSPDHIAIVGEVTPDLALGSSVIREKLVYDAHSFSGHGVMQSYSVGQELAELMLQGKFKSIDLSSFSPARFVRGGSLLPPETWVI